jgi:hypothetical protein
MLVVPMSSKATRLCHLHVEDVKPTWTPAYLGKKAMKGVLDPHESVLDLHVRTVLIQLSQADDRVPQHGDVVDSSEQHVLTKRDSEDDWAGALDLYARGVPKLDRASDARVKLGEEFPSAGHVMSGAGVKAPSFDHVFAGAIAEESAFFRLIKVESAAVAGAAGDSLMLACDRSRASSASASACVTLA